MRISVGLKLACENNVCRANQANGGQLFLADWPSSARACLVALQWPRLIHPRQA